MPPKKAPAPIDRPLSKAYLRQFAGWSTAYPPGMSEPNSLRVMDNVMITRDGAARVRPGLRSYMQTKAPFPIVGSHELFYTAEGKAYLVAVRETIEVVEDTGPVEREVVGFRVIAENDDGEIVMQTLEEMGFSLGSDPESITFSSATTYVRYLQIDNKIYALSNAPDPMVMFWVGEQRKAKRLQGIVRPEWNTADKGSVFHVDGGWVDGSAPTSSRKNLCTNPDFEKSVEKWSRGHTGMAHWWSTAKFYGSRSLGCRSLESRRNYVTSPLYSPHTTGLHGWSAGPRVNRISVEGTSMRIHAERQATDSFGYAWSNRTSVPGGGRFRFAFDLTGKENARKWMTAVRFFRANGDVIGGTTEVGGNTNLTNERKYSKEFVIPSQAASMRVMIGVAPKASNVNAKLDIKNVTLNEHDVSTAALDGEDGADYYWEGTTNASRSLYHPGRDVWLDSDQVGASPGSYMASAYVWGSANVTVQIQARAYNSSGTLIAHTTGSVTGIGSWQRISAPALTAPSGTTRVNVRVIARDLERAERLYVDGVLLERSATLGNYFSGATAKSGNLRYRWAGTAHLSQSFEELFTTTPPTAETPASDTLVSSTKAKNVYSFSFFYTISNELGESAPSQPVTITTQRPWTKWEWETPAGADTDDPELCADQLILKMPQAVFDAAVEAKATKWTGYFSTWGPNDVPPVTAIKFAEVDLSNDPAYEEEGFARLTPRQVAFGGTDPVIPTETTRQDATDPTKGSQGLVAADRLILVGDPTDPARITWSSGFPGDYANFSALLGGGSKQLTSGNLYLTACVKLWQNPQSVDTLTLLNYGDDGRSNAYYMQPATITSLSETINVMGFEEVTGMGGTSSPYGCEVVNNGLYRPEHHALMKSTANNYNITTRTMTDDISNMWRALQQPRKIVSAALDNRIYYLVHNIFGDTLEEHCNGNEVWVLDLASKEPAWSRWRVQGTSLRVMEYDNVVMMSVVHPDGIFTFHPDRYTDDRFADDGTLERVNIPWYLETNTQGANRAHDAWCNLQQANVILGNFEGQMAYGIRGKDVNGMDIDLSKQVVSAAPPPDLTIQDDDSVELFSLPTLSPDSQEDYFLVRKLMKEWVFYAGSIDDVVPIPLDLTPADTLTDVALWEAPGFGYAIPQPDPVAVAEGIELSWNPTPTEGGNGAVHGVRVQLDEGVAYRITITVQADAGAAPWRPCLSYVASGEYVTPDGTEQTAVLEGVMPSTQNNVIGVEVNSGGDWPNAGQHVVTGLTIETFEEEELVPRSSGGQISLVQYRYTPATVNVGYEYGSVETFEYGSSALEGATTDSGTPLPYVDRQP